MTRVVGSFSLMNSDLGQKKRIAQLGFGFPTLDRTKARAAAIRVRLRGVSITHSIFSLSRFIAKMASAEIQAMGMLIMGVIMQVIMSMRVHM